MAVIVVPVVIGAEELALWLLAAAGIYTASKAIPKVIVRVKEKCDDPDHRGRIQAQGGALEVSEPWAQTFPPPKAQGYAQLDLLYNRLSPSDREIRAQPYLKIKSIIAAGPIAAQYVNSFYAPPTLQSKRGDLRMDLEVRKGMAFV